MMDTFSLRNLIEAAQSQTLCDVVLKNARIVNVFTDQVLEGDIGIYQGRIAGIGTYEGAEEIDLAGKWVVPGFIDAHFHIESSMVTPAALAPVLLEHGVTTVLCDPHEIVNACGKDGLDFMLENAKDCLVDYRFMIPSSVPSCDFEVNGAGYFESEDMEPYLQNEKVSGLAEVMRTDDILKGRKEMLDKIVLFKKAGMVIDGHAPSLSGQALQSYRAAGIENDHEAITVEEAIARLQCGFTLFIREGSGAHNLETLLGGLLDAHMPLHNCCLCTDDKHIEDILEEGTIDWSLKKAIALGCPPIEAIKMATLNPARHYHFKTKGAIAPGFDADLVILDNLQDFNILEVYKSGRPISKQDFSLKPMNIKPSLKHTIHLPAFDAKRLSQSLQLEYGIEIVQRQLATRCFHWPSLSEEKMNACDAAVAMERYGHTGEISCAILKGFNLHNGALAASYAHDSHNIIAAGDDFDDLVLAIGTLRSIGGGYVLVEDGAVAATLPLPIGGLMSDQEAKTVAAKAKAMKEKARQMGVPDGVDPFATLSFLSLPVIPEVRITPQGLYDVQKRQFIS